MYFKNASQCPAKCAAQFCLIPSRLGHNISRIVRLFLFSTLFIDISNPTTPAHLAGTRARVNTLDRKWKIRIGRTVSINGAHDAPELTLVRFDLEFPWEATRERL